MPILGLKDYISLGIIGALLLSLAYITWSKNDEIGDLTREKAEVTANWKSAIESATRLESSLTRQNAAIAEMQRRGAAQEAELERVAERARIASQEAVQRSNRILRTLGTGNHEEDSNRLILELTR